MLMFDRSIRVNHQLEFYEEREEMDRLPIFSDQRLGMRSLQYFDDHLVLCDTEFYRHLLLKGTSGAWHRVHEDHSMKFTHRPVFLDELTMLSRYAIFDNTVRLISVHRPELERVGFQMLIDYAK